jgi:L-amino acid N-acyltransferase YncA
MLTIRLSREDDISSITSIYSYYVLNSTCTFEITPPTTDEMRDRRNDVLKRHLPYLVGEVENSIVGYAYCNWFKPRAAYRFSVESSIYLDKNMCGKGFGRQLLSALIQKAELAGIRKMIAGIADSANESSISLHRAAGFTHVGTLKSCGWKFNRWIDVIFMERWIGEGDTTTPEE